MAPLFGAGTAWVDRLRRQIRDGVLLRHGAPSVTVDWLREKAKLCLKDGWEDLQGSNAGTVNEAGIRDTLSRKPEHMCGSELLLLANRLEHAYERYLPEGKGFLPPVTPIDHLPAEFERYQRACDELPDRFGAPNGSVRPWLDGLFSRHDPAINRSIDRLRACANRRIVMLCRVLWIGVVAPE